MMTLNDLICNSRIWIASTDSRLLKKVLADCLAKSDHNILNYMEHEFQPEGFTAIWLLAESHLALHTFPDCELSYIELSSCSRAKMQLFLQEIEQHNLHILNLQN